MTETPGDNKNEDRGILKRLLSYFKPHKGMLFIALLGAVFVGLANAALAPVGKILLDIFSSLTQSVLSGDPINISMPIGFRDHVFHDLHLTSAAEVKHIIWLVTAFTFILVFIKGIVHFGKEYILWQITNKVLMELKHQIFHHIVFLPQSTFDKERSGEMLSRVTYDVTQIENALRSAINFLKAAIYALIYILLLFYMAWELTLLALTVFPLSAVLIKLFGDRVRRISRKVSSNVADYTSFLSEAIGGAKVIKSFGRQQDEENSFNEKIQVNYRYSMKIALLNTLHAPIQEIFSTLGMVVVVIFCAYRMLAGHMTVGDLAAFVILLTNAYKPIKTIGEINVIVQRALASSRYIFALLDEPGEDRVIQSGSKKPDSVKGKIEFRDVSFEYNTEQRVLDRIDLKIQPGETVALVGPSGGGKSTMISLIPRFYPLLSGQIRLDDLPAEEWDLSWLRRQIAIVPQETILFSGTIEDNIRFGNPDADTSDVEKAARAANAHDFITHLHNGYNSQVGERGVQLSGGQRQRIAIARAILRDPRILLLDEATSALDTESERLIQDALDRFRKNRTTVVIAHRLSTIQSADRIAVVEAGKLVEVGTHHELFELGGLYRRLHDQQFAGQ